jgi:hypothetical protein
MQILRLESECVQKLVFQAFSGYFMFHIPRAFWVWLDQFCRQAAVCITSTSTDFARRTLRVCRLQQQMILLNSLFDIVAAWF